MLPTLPFNNSCCLRLAQPLSAGDAGYRFAVDVTLSNFSHNLGCYLRRAVPFALTSHMRLGVRAVTQSPCSTFRVRVDSGLESIGHKTERASMVNVLLWCAIFQVTQTIVVLVRVFVVNAIPHWSRANKGVHHKRCDLEACLLPVFCKGGNAIKRRAPRLENPSGFSLWIWTAITRRVSSYTTKIRHGIQPLISDNIAPFFRLQVVWGKLIISHDMNLLKQWFKLWSGSFTVQPVCGPFVF